MTVLVLTIDQRSSRRRPDLVPAAIAALATVPLLRPFERTAGDEFQGVLDDAAVLAEALEPLLRTGEWNLGVGIGEVEQPLPEHARAGRGPAYVHAREAVTGAKSSPWHLRVVGDDDAVRHLESALWLWASVLGRRSDKGWEVADLLEQQLTYDEVARKLGVTQSAVSQRARAAGIAEGRRGRELVSHLADELLGSAPATGGGR
jgi:hypothetical protein